MQNKKSIHKISIINQDQYFFCSAENSLLSGMELINSRSINIGCRGGGCGTCKIKIKGGSFSRKKMSKAHISNDNFQDGIVLACRIYPTSDLEIEILHKTNLKEVNI